jgi:hypothetical protein
MAFFNRKKNTETRTLSKPDELQVGDLVTLKERSSLPAELQGSDLEVISIGTYQYDGGLEKEITLRSTENKTYYLLLDDNDGDPLLCFSIKIERGMVDSLFDLDQFSILFDNDYAEIKTQDITVLSKGWTKEGVYIQTEKDVEGYFYQDDLIAKNITASSTQSDKCEEFRGFSCELDKDENYSLSIEVWSSGETDIFLEVSVPTDVILEMWPNAK